jgi:hypothetical protein
VVVNRSARRETTNINRLHRRTGKVEGLNRGLCDIPSFVHGPGFTGNDVVVVGVDGRLRRFEEEREECYF